MLNGKSHCIINSVYGSVNVHCHRYLQYLKTDQTCSTFFICNFTFPVPTALHIPPLLLQYYADMSNWGITGSFSVVPKVNRAIEKQRSISIPPPYQRLIMSKHLWGCSLFIPWDSLGHLLLLRILLELWMESRYEITSDAIVCSMCSSFDRKGTQRVCLAFMSFWACTIAICMPCWLYLSKWDSLGLSVQRTFSPN